MIALNRENVAVGTEKPLKVLQFGEGNFLRAFVDYAIHKLNEEQNFDAGVAVVQPIERGMVDMLNDQDGLYTLFSNGVENGNQVQEKHLISCVQKGVDPYSDFGAYISLAKEEALQFIISNTTEAGIAFDENDRMDMAPPNSFPAKLTILLYERYRHFDGAKDKGLTIIPCELINYNADTLKSIILQYIDTWNLEEGFKTWVNHYNSFHNTLVDRIVPGYPKDDIEAYHKKLAYKDNLIVTSEHFFLWVIEGDDDLRDKLPFHKTNLDVKIVADMQPYRTRKVRILNGAHTAMVPLSILYGNQTVEETLEDDFTGAFINTAIFKEIIPTLELDEAELKEFANAVLDRFRNPFIRHELASIALNSFSKFKVRVLPSLLQYQNTFGQLPLRLTFAFACLLRFYKGEWKGRKLPIEDAAAIQEHLAELWAQGDIKHLVKEVLSNETYWEYDLNQIEGLASAMAIALEAIEEKGVEKGYEYFEEELIS